VRPVRYTTQLSRHAELLERIRALHAGGLRAPAIARALRADGWRSAHGKSFTEGSVRALLTRMGVLSTSPKRPSAVVARHEGELTVAEVSARLNLPEGTIYNWLYKRRLSARRVAAAWHTLWLVRLEDVEALLRQRLAGGRLPPEPARR
jgi:excisionase family DNA binding protein